MSQRSATFTPDFDHLGRPPKDLEGRMAISRMILRSRCRSFSPATPSAARRQSSLPKRKADSSAAGPQALPAIESWFTGVAPAFGASRVGWAVQSPAASAKARLLALRACIVLNPAIVSGPRIPLAT